MNIVTLEQFNQYTNNKNTNQDAVTQKEMFIDSAEQIVMDYLGFNPKRANVDGEVHYIPMDCKYINTDALPVNSISYMEIDGEEVDVEEVVVYKECLYYPKGFKTGQKVSIGYESGWSSRNMPKVIPLTVLRIASLLMAESNGNIGVTGLSSPMGDSRTFINYTNFNKYLQELAPYRVIRL